MTPRKRITFDTSAINTITDRGEEGFALQLALTAGYTNAFTAMSADEIIATKSPERRAKLLQCLGRVLSSALCLLPAGEITKALVQRFHANPTGFDWRRLNIRCSEYENAIVRRDFDEAICAEQREQARAVAKEFREIWEELRPRLDPIFAREPESRPTSFGDTVEIAKIRGTVLLTQARRLYTHVTQEHPGDEMIEDFLSRCPPFQVACHSMIMAWHNFSLRDEADDSAVTGRNDLLMAVYLPYCDIFLTDDWAQRRDLTAIAVACGIQCEVMGTSDLENRMLIAPARLD